MPRPEDYNDIVQKFNSLGIRQWSRISPTKFFFVSECSSMGGNALKAESVRLAAPRYREVEADILARLRARFPALRIEAIAAFANKPDFGDLDVLVESSGNYDHVQLALALDATETVCNGEVTSIGVQLAEGIFQVDLVETPSATFDFAENYFGHNDFGNLVGRVAHKFGTKFGHRGLIYTLRDPDNQSQLITDVTITTDFDTALDLLGYDAGRYREIRRNGDFKTLEDIFDYVVTTPYAHPAIYDLDNRSRKARIRDVKRATYTAFLAWLDARPQGAVPKYGWGEEGSALQRKQRDDFLNAALARLPAFKARYDQALADWHRAAMVKRQFNGAIAAECTGLSGKALGDLMARVRNSFQSIAEFEVFFMEANAQAVRQKFMRHAAADNIEN
jgi:hypothetical protein